MIPYSIPPDKSRFHSRKVFGSGLHQRIMRAVRVDVKIRMLLLNFSNTHEAARKNDRLHKSSIRWNSTTITRDRPIRLGDVLKKSHARHPHVFLQESTAADAGNASATQSSVVMQLPDVNAPTFFGRTSKPMVTRRLFDRVICQKNLLSSLRTIELESRHRAHPRARTTPLRPPQVITHQIPDVVRRPVAFHFISTRDGPQTNYQL